MNIKKEQIKMKIFLILYIVFAILSFIGVFMVITKRLTVLDIWICSYTNVIVLSIIVLVTNDVIKLYNVNTDE